MMLSYFFYSFATWIYAFTVYPDLSQTARRVLDKRSYHHLPQEPLTFYLYLIIGLLIPTNQWHVDGEAGTFAIFTLHLDISSHHLNDLYGWSTSRGQCLVSSWSHHRSHARKARKSYPETPVSYLFRYPQTRIDNFRCRYEGPSRRFLSWFAHSPAYT